MTDTRRVLVVSDEMEVGGSQRQIATLLCGIDRTRWQAELVYFRERSFLVDQIEAPGIATHCIRKRAGLDPAFVLNLRQYVRRLRPDLIHCFSLTAELWIRALLPTLPRTVFIASIRGLFHVYAPWQWRAKRWILGRCELAVANSQAGARETATRTGFPLQRIAIVANGVAVPAAMPVEERARTREALDIPAARLVALFAGRLVAEKNLPLLLAAWAQMARDLRPLLLLAGGGPLEHSLRIQINQFGLGDDVRLLGERRDITGLMQVSDIVVLPSLEEGLSNVLLEAMAVGCAVLASDVGGNPELIDSNQTGLLFESGNPEALLSALETLCGNAALRVRLGEAARNHIRAHYAIEPMVAATEALWLRALNDRRQQ